jgi:YspA, cpYpsA-related SLOG family
MTDDLDYLRILVTGSRLLTDEHQSLVEDALIDTADEYERELGTSRVVVVHGGASGADRLCAKVAHLFGWEVEPYLADWRVEINGRMTLDKLAGHKRNQAMVDAGADVCVAFVRPCELPKCRRKPAHTTHGTRDCIERAERAGIPVREFAA